MELLVLWVLFAIATGVIASNKGRSGIGWGLLGLIFGIFALIIVAVLPNLNAQAEERERHAQLVAAVAGGQPAAPADSGGARRPCPRCGESIPVAASVCRFCGNEMTGAPA